MTLALRSKEPAMRPEIIGTSKPILRAIALIEQFAPTNIPILIVGPTGVGKELFASLAHFLSGRSHKVDVNCALLPRELADSQLFGHRRGSFSGAIETTDGLIAEADGGTLFLDELGSLATEVQPKLLRVLETGLVGRVGDGGRARAVDFRLVAAAQQDIGALASARGFRADLLQRMAGVVIEAPPLSERRGDIPALAERFAAAAGKAIDDDAVALFASRPWDGNVRELKWTIERAAWLASGHQIGVTEVREACELGMSILGTRIQPSASDELLTVCEESQWDVGAIMRRTGLSRSALYRRLRERGLQPAKRRRRF